MLWTGSGPGADLHNYIDRATCDEDEGLVQKGWEEVNWGVVTAIFNDLVRLLSWAELSLD